MAVAVLALFFQYAAANPLGNTVNNLLLPTSLDLFTTTPSAAFPSSLASTPVPDVFKAWAQFCNDDNCSEDCGQWVDLSNSGCLNEAGRRSFRTKTDGDEIDVGLVYSPAESCPCQTRCDFVYDYRTSTCHVLNDTLAPSTLSYRFINFGNPVHVCSEGNNCPATDDTLEDLTTTSVDLLTPAPYAPSDSSSSTVAQPENDYTNWAQFCNDEDCSDGCGEWVDMANPGCLNEAGRKSFRTKSNGPNIAGGLVYSPAASCPCQTMCDPINEQGGWGSCHVLNGTFAASTFSYRWIAIQDCPGQVLGGADDNCPATKLDSTLDNRTTTDNIPELAIALPPVPHSKGNKRYDAAWARFCDDDACSSGCGQWVSVSNEGCMSESGRNSVQIKPNEEKIEAKLVYSPDYDCGCQVGCDVFMEGLMTGECQILNQTLASGTHSYRFIDMQVDDEACGANDCSVSNLDPPDMPIIGLDPPDTPIIDGSMDTTELVDHPTNTTNTPGPDTGLSAWGRFCDDTDCSVNCGEWVDLSNTGCLHDERGRKSIRSKANGLPPIAGVVYSPDDACGCQTECDDFSQEGCWVLNQTLAATTGSYRFINAKAFGSCDGSEDNCH